MQIFKEIWAVLQEQIKYFPVIWRLSQYETKAKYKDHALGVLWDIINPVMQIATYWVVFGFAMKQHGTTDGVPYIAWLVIGLAVWLFINTSFMDSTWSIRANVRQVSKMNFPISIMPAVRTWINVLPFFITLAVGIIISMSYGIKPTVHWFQFFYYFFATMVFLHAVGIFNATITVLYPDYQQLIQTIMRFVFWMSGAVFDIASRIGTEHIKAGRILEMNPFYYLISGVRDSFLNTGWLWDKPWETISFWVFVGLLLIIGSHLHLKFRAYFADLI
ncbi:MAG: ABC transporter permease [Lactobacillaceae bacterium]|jgi:teichoic acid transport system permease protein|nr:ABC transporter permease [Lactobacillaceae bacterium]